MALFAKIDTAFTRDIKVRRAGPHGRLLYLQLILWSKENRTDGVLHAEFLADVALDIPTPAKHVRKLVDVGLLVECDGGWRIPLEVWSEWNLTASELDAKAGRKRAAGQRGNHNRWHTPSNPSDSCDLCHDAGWIAGAIADAITEPIANDRQSDRAESDRAERQSVVTDDPLPDGYLEAVERVTDALTARFTATSNPEAHRHAITASIHRSHGDTIRQRINMGGTPATIAHDIAREAGA